MDEVRKLPEADQVFEIPISYEEKGKEIGKEIGKKIGKKEGTAIGVRKVAVEMLKKDVDLNFIAEVTHLDIDEIVVLKQQLQ